MSSKTTMVNILLTTHNCEDSIKKVLESIAGQDYKNWLLIIRDNNSTDKTVDIIKEFIINSKIKVRIIESSNEKTNLECLKTLINASSYGYSVLAEQDDVWMSNRLSSSIERMCELDGGNTSSLPILIHTNYYTVDEDEKLEPVCIDNFMKSNFKDSLLSNDVNITTCIINRPMQNLIMRINSEDVDLSWWLSLIAGSMGIKSYIDDTTVADRYLYNQLELVVDEDIVNSCKVQAKVFKETFKDKLSKEVENEIDKFLETPNLDLVKAKSRKGGLKSRVAAFFGIK